MRTLPNGLPALLLSLALLAGIAGCGQKGPLVLPPDDGAETRLADRPDNAE